MKFDYRHIANGMEIPSEGYCDQPYTVVNKDGSWTLVMTTGNGVEGQSGQHVVSLWTRDQGRSWEGPFDIEPASGPEASWAMPLLVPQTGRIYVFYTYNSENLRQIATGSGGVCRRVDSLGSYAYKYSDDMGRTWSHERFEIPMRLFSCDRANVTGGKVLFFWGVGKPFIHKGLAYVCASKVGVIGKGFFEQNEGVLFRCSNLLTESDARKHRWETLPDGEIGLRTPADGGPIAGEFNAVPMACGYLYGTYRTIDGWACDAVSKDDGHTWESGWMTYGPGKRRVKNPRCANFVRRFANGKYLYWYSFNGGEKLGRHPDVANYAAYENRNPVWMCGGVERDGRVCWSEPEIVLYDDKLGHRSSYPDFVEQDGRVFITETQKEIARVHQIEPTLLDALWSQHEARDLVRDGLVLDVKGDRDRVQMPLLPTLHNRNDEAPPDKSLFLPPCAVVDRGGLTIECRVRFDDLDPWQTLFDNRDDEGRGMLLQLTDRATLRLSLAGPLFDLPGSRTGNSMADCGWDCDRGLIMAGQEHCFAFIVDGGSKTICVVVDGTLCDGGRERRFGWGRFHPCLMDVNGAQEARIASALHGEIKALRIYGRRLLTSEAVANYRSGL